MKHKKREPWNKGIKTGYTLEELDRQEMLNELAEDFIEREAFKIVETFEQKLFNHRVHAMSNYIRTWKPKGEIR